MMAPTSKSEQSQLSVEINTHLLKKENPPQKLTLRVDHFAHFTSQAAPLRALTESC